MPQLQPLPVFINEAAGADRGLICGYQLAATEKPREISADSIVESLARHDVVTWLHFNLSDARARRWLLEAQFLPSALREVLQEHDENRRIEIADGGLLLVISDFAFDGSDPSEVETLWCFAGANLLITARLHPLRSADELRLQLRNGAEASTGMELLCVLLDLRTARLKSLAQEMTTQLDQLEDEILAGSIKQQREQLGRMRRLCARLRREFAPERTDFIRFLHRATSANLPVERESLQSIADLMGFAIEEIAELYERAKLLQEELASRLAESTSRNLYVLSILTAVLLPMTLVTGIFGMNIAGMPGLHNAAAFWNVMLLILASGALTLVALFWRRLL
jgi:zinc transporter